MEENLLRVSCPHHSTLKAFMPLTFSKLGAHIGLALSVCALPRLGACETREWHESLYMAWAQKISEPVFFFFFFFFFFYSRKTLSHCQHDVLRTAWARIQIFGILFRISVEMAWLTFDQILQNIDGVMRTLHAIITMGKNLSTQYLENCFSQDPHILHTV